MEQILITCWITFGALLEPILELNRLQKGTKNGTTFGTTSLRVSGVRGLRFQEFYERCAKSIGIGIILSEKKGRNLLLKLTLLTTSVTSLSLT